MEESSKTDEAPPKPEFKKPVLIGRVGKLPKKAKVDAEKVEVKYDQSTKEPKKPVESSSNAKSSLPPALLLKEISTPIPYKEPKWSGLCPEGSEYSLEVLKSGMIVERVDLTTKPYFVFGRLANSDVMLAHPTISRYGPDFDCEGESELSVTEIKKRAEAMKIERDRMIQEAIEQRERDRLAEEKRKEEQGIDWGMGEDAEEEPDLADNPFASTGNEELFLEDPKKTLRGYFEREGHELSYDCEERGVGQFICRVELPMDDARGRPVVAEVIHKGKKKEAVVACALEACRVLDRAGLLRQAKHESRRRKQRDWSADDYYDSDEDTFLDRTGAVERKRDKRMQAHAREDSKKDEPLTYDGLLKQVSEIEGKISIEEKGLERLRALGKSQLEDNSEDGDSLDNFMSTLNKQGHSMAQKAEISNTKMRIQKLKAELNKTQRLAEVARPAHLPPLLKREDKNKMAVKLGSNSVVYGKRIRLKEDSEKRPRPKQAVKQEEGEFVEEMDSDEESAAPEDSRSQLVSSDHSLDKLDERITEGDKESTEGDRESPKGDKKSTEGDKRSTKGDKRSTESDKRSTKGEKGSTEDEKEVKRVFGPMRPPDNYVMPESYFNQESDRDLPEIMENEG